MDAFLIRYFNGKHEIYLVSDKNFDQVLDIMFYDVVNLNPNVTPLFLSFGIDQTNYIVGDTSHGYQFSALLHATQSSKSCTDSAPAPTPSPAPSMMPTPIPTGHRDAHAVTDDDSSGLPTPNLETLPAR